MIVRKSNLHKNASFYSFKMLIIRECVRSMHTSCVWFNTNKSLLAKLRKNTGYTFANCKKALEVSNNDLKKVRTRFQFQSISLCM